MKPVNTVFGVYALKITSKHIMNAFSVKSSKTCCSNFIAIKIIRVLLCLILKRNLKVSIVRMFQCSLDKYFIHTKNDSM